MIFNSKNNNSESLQQPMFFGDELGIQRFDKFAFPIFDKLTQKQLGFFWRPEEVALNNDRIDYQSIPEAQKHIFTANLKYQILLDSVQGRGPVALLPYVSVPELEACIITWDFFETIHSRSYTHIIKNVYANPSKVFDTILDDERIISRAMSVTSAYDNFIKLGIQYQHDKNSVNINEIKKKLFMAILNINILEGLRFYVSFACTFAFGEMKKMEGSAKIIRFIARDEAQHYAITQHILKNWRADPEMKKIMSMKSTINSSIELFKIAAEEEKDWAKYLFSSGSMIGLNEALLCQYVEWMANKRFRSLGMDTDEILFPDAPKQNPLPWTEHWLSNKNVQVAPQETEISSYLVGGVNMDSNDEMIEGFEL